MTLKMRVEITGADDAVSDLEGIASRAGDVRPALEAIRASFYASERRRFATSGNGDWAPDLPGTLARKARRGQDLRTLRATGALYRSLTSPDAPGAVFRVSGEGFEIGTSLRYAQWAQKGTGQRRRPPIFLSRAVRKRWASKLRKWVREGKL